MNKHLKNESGFTLVEMLIVLLIISVLIILIIPNLAGKTSEVQNKGCSALMAVVDAQINSYQMDNGETPKTIDVLVGAKYLDDGQTTCPNNNKLTISDGKATIIKK